jgi:hypothetical protein
MMNNVSILTVLKINIVFGILTFTPRDIDLTAAASCPISLVYGATKINTLLAMCDGRHMVCGETEMHIG